MASGIVQGSYVLMTISCPSCEKGQVVQVRARTGFAQMSLQSVDCVGCKNQFEVMLPDSIVGGPFIS
jgi:ssDNA-binding Zn-finger/Zn-ribbon topoisomerase 1